jgi:hypothetical protein
MRASLPTRRMEEPEQQPAESQQPKPTAANAAQSKKKNDRWPLVLFAVVVMGIMLAILVVAGIMLVMYFANGGRIF